MVCPPHKLREWRFRHPATYDKLKKRSPRLTGNTTHTATNFFFTLPPRPTSSATSSSGLRKSAVMSEENSHWRRVIVEKPFGHDLDSAKALNQQFLKVASECQDLPHRPLPGKGDGAEHLALRFANGIFEPIWNRRYIDHVQIRSSKRSAWRNRRLLRWSGRPARPWCQPHHATHYIDCDGTAISFEANAVRDEQAKILHAIQPFSNEDVLSRTVRGQYGEGTMDNERVPATAPRRACPRIRAPKPSSP